MSFIVADPLFASQLHHAALSRDSAFFLLQREDQRSGPLGAQRILDRLDGRWLRVRADDVRCGTQAETAQFPDGASLPKRTASSSQT